MATGNPAWRVKCINPLKGKSLRSLMTPERVLGVIALFNREFVRQATSIQTQGKRSRIYISSRPISLGRDSV